MSLITFVVRTGFEPAISPTYCKSALPISHLTIFGTGLSISHMSLLFSYRLSFGFRSENSFGKEKDRSFWKLTKPQPYTLCYFNVSTIALTWTSVKKTACRIKWIRTIILCPLSPSSCGLSLLRSTVLLYTIFNR